LRVSPNPVSALLLVAALVLTLFAWNLPEPDKALNFALSLFIVVGITWVLNSWQPRIGRWSAILALVVIIQLASSWLGVTGCLALMAIPTLLAAMTIGLPAAAIVTVGETLLLLMLPRYIPSSAGQAEIGAALAAIWISLGLIYEAYRPIQRLAQWSWEHFQNAQRLLEQARDRQAELKEALDALAHANRELALTNEKLAVMRLVAEEARKMKAAFVGNVSHEFRTPLNIIIGLAEILLDAPEVYGEELSPSVRRDLRILYRNCEHLSSMIDDVLDLSQVEAGRLGLYKEQVDLGNLIDSALQVVFPLLDRKGLDLIVSVPEDLPRVYCDPTRIRQVILNLISNAARFTQVGSVAVQVSAQNQYIIVSVADTGPGISPEDAKRIFEPFQQALTARQRGGLDGSRATRGSGLGLSISKGFVELHDGRMWLESKLGEGSTFFFRLPISPLADLAAPPERWIADGYITRTARPDVPVARLDQRVVLCDETGELYPLFSRSADQIEFVDTRDLAQASGARKETAAQAIVVNAPSPDELSLLVTQASQAVPDTPIIGCSLPRKRAHAVIAGAKGYLLKPIRRADLEEVLRSTGRPVRRILVVDDEEDTLWVLRRMLSACDSHLEVTTATSGAQALEELRCRPPDLMLLDIIMPDMDGWQVLAAKRQDETIRDIPVAIISAQDPQKESISSRIVTATMGEGLSISKLLGCLRALSALLLQPDWELCPAPE